MKVVALSRDPETPQIPKQGVNMKIAVLSPDPETLKQVHAVIVSIDSSLRLQLFEGALGRTAPLVEQEHPDLLIVDLGNTATPDLRALASVTAGFPAMSVILLSPQPTPEFLIEAMRIGVREVLPSPVPREALQHALGRIGQRVSSAAAPRTKGKIFAFMGCKGGSGATFLAANLGYAMAKDQDKHVALIDLNLNFGEALHYISDAVPSSTVADVARQIHRLDGAFLESSAVQVLPNFSVLAAPENPEKSIDVKPESVERLLNVAVNHYDFVLLDISRNLDAVSLKALDQADTIFLVLQMALPFIRDTKRLIVMFRSLGYPSSKIKLIVNRHEKGGEITLADIEHTLGVSVFKTVPNSHAAVTASINHGTPLLRLAPRDPIAKPLQEVAQAMCGIKPSSGWLRGVLARTA